MLVPLTLRGELGSAALSFLAARGSGAFSRLVEGSTSSGDGTSCQTGRSSMFAVSDGFSFLKDDSARTFLSSLTVTGVPSMENLSLTMYSANDRYPASSFIHDCFVGGP